MSGSSFLEVLRKVGRPAPEQVSIWQAMTPVRRLDLAFQAYQFALDIVRMTERQRHPELTPEKLAWQIARRMQADPHLGR